jgi:hypothetical protein
MLKNVKKDHVLDTSDSGSEISVVAQTLKPLHIFITILKSIPPSLKMGVIRKGVPLSTQTVTEITPSRLLLQNAWR